MNTAMSRWLNKLGREDAQNKRPKRPLRPDLLRLETREVLSVTIQVNFDYDTGNFFNTPAKRDALQEVANNLASSLNDSLAAITPSARQSWTGTIIDPSTGTARKFTNLTVPDNTIIVYAGGRGLSGNTYANGNPAISASSGPVDWQNLVLGRGKPGAIDATPTSFAPWGGSISFDTSSTNWSFNTSPEAVAPGTVDFSTVASRELLHVLGVGTSPSWQRNVVAGATPDQIHGVFNGAATNAANAGLPVPLGPEGFSFRNDVTADGARDLLDSNAGVSTAVSTGRKLALSSLDYAALSDTGWNVTAPSKFQFAGTTVSPLPTLAVYPAQTIPTYVVPGNAGVATITVTRMGSSVSAATVDYRTEDVVANPSVSTNAAVAGVNYATTSGTLSFAAGETSKTFTVQVMDDGLNKGYRGFNVVLINPSAGAQLGSVAVVPVLVADSVPNTAPKLDQPSDAFGTVGDPFTTLVHATDANASQVITYSLAPGSPGTATINKETGQIKFTPTAGPANLAFVVVATDNGVPALSDSKIFYLRVAAPPAPPVVLPTAPPPTTSPTTTPTPVVTTPTPTPVPTPVPATPAPAPAPTSSPSTPSVITTTPVIAPVAVAPAGTYGTRSVAGVNAVISKNRVTGISVAFNGPLDPNSAQNPGNYTISTPGKRVGRRMVPGRTFPITSTSYNAATNVVTVTIPAVLKSNQVFMFRINAGAGGVTDTTGTSLNSLTLHGPGSDYTATLVAKLSTMRR